MEISKVRETKHQDVADEKTAATQNTIVDVNTEELQTSFQYLNHEFNEEELKNLEQKYQLSRTQLEEIIIQNKSIYRLYYLDKICTNTSNLLYISFILKMNDAAFATLVKTISPNLEVPPAVSNGIGIPFAVVDMVAYMFIFSPHKEAVLSALGYLFRNWFHLRLISHAQYLCHQPKVAIKAGAEFIFDETLNLICNATGVMTEIIGLSSLLSELPVWAQVLIDIPIMIFGIRYMKYYTTSEYYKGKKFWKNDENYPWLIFLIWEEPEKIPVCFEIALQGVATLVTRADPLYWFIAVGARAALGWWFGPGWDMALLAGIQGIFMIYPTSYFEYLKDRYIVDKLVFEIFDVSTERFIRDNHLAPESHIPTLKKKILNQIRKSIEERIEQIYGRFFLFKKEPESLMPVTYMICAGAYLGYGISVLAEASLPILIPAACVVGLAFGIMSYYAELHRTRDQSVRKLLEAYQKELANNNNTHLATFEFKTVLDAKEIKNIANLTPCEKQGTNACSYILNVSSGFVSFMTLVGAMALLAGDAPVAVAVVGIVAGKSMINNLAYKREKIVETVQGTYVTTKKYAKSLCKWFSCSKQNFPDVKVEMARSFRK